MRRNLYLQVLVAIAIGVALGVLKPDVAQALKPLGDVFVKTVRMLIGPVIFCTVVGGLAGLSDLRRLGRVGWKALVYFEAVTTVALVIGLVVAKVVQPGAGFHVDPATLNATTIAGYATGAEQQGTVAFLTHIVPATFIGAFADGEILQILFLAILFGVVLAKMGERGKAVGALVHDLTGVFFGLVNLVVRAAPIAALGAMAFTVGAYGLGTLVSLGKLMASVYLTCLLFIFVVLGGILRLHGFSILGVLRMIREELLIVLGTSSSESALPLLMQKLKANGCGDSVVGIVVPSGYSFNLDGTCIYLTMAVLFIAQATDVSLTLGEELSILGVLLLTSKGAAAVTGGGFITLAATLATTGGKVPIAGLALILGVDRFMSEARAITNLIGNTVAALVVSKWERDFDAKRGGAILSGPAPGPDA
ncbi:MAG: C4-dicarboxylate transporter DctA [Vicinamibacterales bacterium]